MASAVEEKWLSFFNRMTATFSFSSAAEEKRCILVGGDPVSAVLFLMKYDKL
jgi:hypothetical protein